MSAAAPSKSATVRATRKSRSNPRPDSASCLATACANPAAPPESAETVITPAALPGEIPIRQGSSVAPDGTKNHLWKSTNFGTSWTALPTTGLTGGITHVNAAAGDALALAVVGGSTGAASYNGGTNWSAFGTFPAAVSLNYVAFDSQLQNLLKGVLGR